MSTESTKDWNEANQRYLMAALKAVQEELETYQAQENKINLDDQSIAPASSRANEELEKAATDLPAPSALDTLVGIFGLSHFERKLLLLCAGVELDADFSKLIQTLQGNSSLTHPTFSLALAAFTEAHWSAIAPNSPIRYWQLIKVHSDEVLVKSPLRIDEQVLHYLIGVQSKDERLREILEPVYTYSFLVPSHWQAADAILLACLPGTDHTPLPVLHLRGSNHADKISIAAFACARMELTLYTLSALSIPGNAIETGAMVRLWNREAALNRSALFLDCTELDTNSKSQLQLVTNFIENVQGVMFLNTNDNWKPELKRPTVIQEVNKPTPEEQLLLWEKGFKDAADHLAGMLDEVVAQFNLSANTIEAVCREVAAGIMENEEEENSIIPITHSLWRTCCVHTRPRVDELAQRLEPVAGWEDIVLPVAQLQLLREIILQVKHRNKVYEEWGFAGKSSRGLGISALFTGESGTGKTMAAEVLAKELQLDLYRIDLSQVVNKYIGETEKNLKRIFDAAEEGGVILLFDEADALFGKRSDVKDSHDRYSNIEVSYLLQRMEAYRGLAILTTNMKTAIDKAFLRRIRFVVPFPYPDVALRAEIWRRVFPDDTPVKELDMEKLSKLSVPGGNIRNIALNAAFMAAGDGEPVQMRHIARATRTEYSKIEKTLTTSETEGWT